MTPPINSVSDERLAEMLVGLAGRTGSRREFDKSILVAPDELRPIITELAARRAADTPVDGWVVVPRKATDQMYVAFRDQLNGGGHIYRFVEAYEAMLAAAPASQASEPDVWQHRLRAKHQKTIGWSEWRDGKPNLSSIALDGLDIEERGLYTHPAPSASREVTDPLDALAKHPSWEIDYGPSVPNDEESDYAWRVFEVSGNVNDREWTLLGFGDTPRAALLAALPEREG